jgi:uncharacterized spore protein YtfJ
MNLNQLLAQIKSLVSNAAGVEMAFGQPTKVNDIHIVPVAKVAFGFGGGGGSSPAKMRNKTAEAGNPVDDGQQEATPEGKAAQTDFGGGGGGGMQTYPIGIYSIKDDVIKFHPVISIKEIIALITVLSFVLMRLFKRKNKGKK